MRPEHGRRPVLLLAAILTFCAAAAHADAPAYNVTDTLHLAGPVRWDYLTFDADAHRLFITRGESVDVLDVLSKTIVGSIPDTHGVHGVALAPSLNRGFISDGKTNSATVFDLATLKTIATVPTGTKPDAIVYDPTSQRVFTANGESDDLTVIDAKDAKVLSTIKVGGDPEFAAVDGEGRLYVNLENKAQLVVVDTKELKVLAHYDLAPKCDGPTGLSIDTAQHRLFVSCANKVMLIVDAATGHILETLPIGEHSDATLFDPSSKLAFSSNGDGTLTIIGQTDADHYSVVQTVKTLPTARTMALNPGTHEIYLAAAETEGFEPAKNGRPPRPHMKADTFMIVTVAPKSP